MSHQLSYVTALEKLAKETQEEFATLMPHMGERGRIGEEILKSVLLRLLPKRFSIGTGVIISSDGQVSNQMDIVIYDHINNSPLLTEYSANLFPIECVYATVEVKTVVTRTELEKSLMSIKKIRDMSATKAYIGRTNLGKETRIKMTVPPRAYLFGFRQKGLGKDVLAFQKTLATSCDDTHSHIHGVGVLSTNWFANRVPYKKPAEIRTYSGGALLNLYKAIIQHQTNFMVLPMDISAYIP